MNWIEYRNEHDGESDDSQGSGIEIADNLLGNKASIIGLGRRRRGEQLNLEKEEDDAIAAHLSVLETQLNVWLKQERSKHNDILRNVMSPSSLGPFTEEEEIFRWLRA